MRAGHVFSIAPDAPFLDTLVARVLDGTLLFGWPREGPFWLSDITIVLPTRRAQLRLGEAFLRRCGPAVLLPDIRTFGGEQEDEEPFLPPGDAPPLPPEVSATERRLTLGRLIEAWARTPEGREVLATPPHAAEILAFADSLAEVLDSIAIEGADFRRLDGLAEELELTANWESARRFLMLALEAWPAILAERRKADAVVLRNERLRRQARAAPAIYGDRPVIAAGSTGSIAATAELLRAIADLPRGALVLPGLDTSLSPEDHAALLQADAALHGHPQYGLARLLETLRVAPGAVTELGPDRRAARTLVVRQALASAEDTAGWAAARERLALRLGEAADGLAILAARTEDEEARGIALVARDALARGRTAGIVTPDRNLARRIVAELRRFGIDVDDSAGQPLFQSAAGCLVRQLVALAERDCAPVDLVALLRNPAVTFGLPRQEVSLATDTLELRFLRDPLAPAGLDGLRRAVEAARDKPEGERGHLGAEPAARALGLIERIGAMLAPLRAALDEPRLTAAAFAAQLAAAVDAAAPGDEAPPGRDVFARWAAEVGGHPGEGPAFARGTLESGLARLMAGYVVRPLAPRRDDIHIWGQLEARLQNPDLMILCGLNEDIWPAVADPGPWLSRNMRLAIGLEPPERAQGQAAHDFAMALGNTEVVLATADRIGTSPAVHSRLLQRLEAFLGEPVARAARARGDVWLARARRLDAIGRAPVAAPRPAPRPPAALRPTQLSVTQIETLFRSPYDIYARTVLRLSRREPLGQQPGPRERGNFIHDVFAAFVAAGHPFDDTAHGKLMEMAESAFARLEGLDDRRDIWLRRFTVAASRFVEFERAREPEIAARNAEVSEIWQFPVGFTLTGRADRVDRRVDGTLEILDFKTGSVPQKKEMEAFLKPQLLLEAAMAQAVGMGPVAPATVSALTYVKIRQGPDGLRPRPFTPADGNLAGAIEAAAHRLQAYVQAMLLSDSLPMAARIIPDNKQRFRGDYDHLARTDEWLVQEDEDFPA